MRRAPNPAGSRPVGTHARLGVDRRCRDRRDDGGGTCCRRAWRRRHRRGGAGVCCAAVGGALLLRHHPLVPVLAGPAPLAAVVALRQPFLPCLGFIIFSFFRIHEVFPFLTPLHIPQMLAIGALAALATQLACGRVKVYWARELPLFLLFFALVTIGLLFATDRGDATATWQGTYVKIAVMILAIVWLARGPREFALTARAMIVAGIVIGMINGHDVVPDLIAGLKILEYRGYDSAGVAVVGETGVERRRVTGRITAL